MPIADKTQKREVWKSPPSLGKWWKKERIDAERLVRSAFFALWEEGKL